MHPQVRNTLLRDSLWNLNTYGNRLNAFPLSELVLSVGYVLLRGGVGIEHASTSRLPRAEMSTCDPPRSYAMGPYVIVHNFQSIKKKKRFAVHGNYRLTSA